MTGIETGRVGLAQKDGPNQPATLRNLPTHERLLGALKSFDEEGVIEASIEDLATRARNMGGAKHWWEDRVSPAKLSESIHYLIGNQLVLPRYHLDVTTHDRQGQPVKKLLFRLAPEKNPEPQE